MNTSWTSRLKTRSHVYKKTPTITQAISTTTTPWISCAWVGHSTFLSSAIDSPMKPRTPPPRAALGSRAGSGRAAARAVGLEGGAGGPPGRAASLLGRHLRPAGTPLRTRLACHLARLPVSGVTSTPAAVLADLEPVGRVPLRLGAHVVPPLALVAGERDFVSYSSGHFSLELEGKRTPRQDPGPRGYKV